MDILSFCPEHYSLAIDLLTRMLGVLYVIVYVPFLFQMRGLYGKEGILPIEELLKSVKQRFGYKSYYLVPSVFWFNASDTALYVFTWTGIILGVLLAFGVCPPVILLLHFILHLSLVSAGQDFMSFGWETLLIEITMMTLLTVSTSPPNLIAWIGLNFLLLRFMIQAGYSKFRSGDKNWRNLTALSFHYLSQPIPNRWAWYMDKLPMWFHKMSTLFMFWVELIMPLFIFNIPEVRLFVFFNFAALLAVIALTGNFSYLNLMTFIFSLILLNNQFLEPFLGSPAMVEPSHIVWQVIISVISAILLCFEAINLWHYFFPSQRCHNLLSYLYPFHICHPHQLFSVMTTGRSEIVIEGSTDGNEWKEYYFWFKPSEVSRTPRQIAPFQPRIDWQAWFLPFRPFRNQIWFQKMITKLLQGSKPVGKLLRYNPYPDTPPKYIRVQFYSYEYTTWQERKETGNWWKRKNIGMYATKMELNQPKPGPVINIQYVKK